MISQGDQGDGLAGVTIGVSGLNGWRQDGDGPGSGMPRPHPPGESPDVLPVGPAPVTL